MTEQRTETALVYATTPTAVTDADRERAARWLDGADAAGLIGHWRLNQTRASLAALLAEVRREEREACIAACEEQARIEGLHNPQFYRPEMGAVLRARNRIAQRGGDARTTDVDPSTASAAATRGSYPHGSAGRDATSAGCPTRDEGPSESKCGVTGGERPAPTPFSWQDKPGGSDENRGARSVERARNLAEDIAHIQQTYGVVVQVVDPELVEAEAEADQIRAELGIAPRPAEALPHPELSALDQAHEFVSTIIGYGSPEAATRALSKIIARAQQRRESPSPRKDIEELILRYESEISKWRTEVEALRKVEDAAKAFADAPCCEAGRGCDLSEDLVPLPTADISCPECRAFDAMRDALAAVPRSANARNGGGT